MYLKWEYLVISILIAILLLGSCKAEGKYGIEQANVFQTIYFQEADNTICSITIYKDKINKDVLCELTNYQQIYGKPIISKDNKMAVFSFLDNKSNTRKTVVYDLFEKKVRNTINYIDTDAA